jgi:glycosyltransferase involved in cell wall biosynthesis
MKEEHHSNLAVNQVSVPSSSLKVLFVSHAYVVGVNQGKLAAIAETGEVEVGLLAPSNWQAPEWNRLMPVERPFSNIKIYEAPVLFSGRGGAHFYAPWQVWQILNDFKPDIVQVEAEVFSLCAFELAIWARLKDKPLVVFGWENMERQLPLPRQKICQFVLNTASAIIPGNEDGAKVMRLWGYSGLLEVMPQMGVDTHLFAPTLVNRTTDEFNIGFLGRLVPSKGIDILFAAVRQLRDKGIKCFVTICGSGQSESDLRQEAENLGIQDCVVWRGAVRHEQAPQEISQMDVLVLPSRTTATWKEQFGHVLIEAMAMGVPVVGSSSGEIPHVIGRSDLVFQEDDGSGLAAILERLEREPTWRREVSQYGIIRVQQMYSHQKIAERLVNLWQTVLKQKNEQTPLI